MNEPSNKPAINMYACLGINNFGDEMSPYLIKALTNCPINLAKIHVPNKLVAVGSIVGLETLLTASQFWGSGLLLKCQIKEIKPKFIQAINNLMITPLKNQRLIENFSRTKFYALRGPLTAQALQYIGIPSASLPKVFSDPALLMPYVYQAKPTGKRYELGIILHHTQPEEEMSDFIQQHYGDKVKLISIFRRGEEQVHDFIDEICSCDKIASVALHGLILAQAYGIPAQFIQSTQHQVYDNCVFKYNDYFLGTQQKPQSPLIYSSNSELIPKLLKHNFQDPPKFRQLCQNLLDVFPYQDRLKLKSLPY